MILALLLAEFFALDTAMVRTLGTDRIQKADVELLADLGYSGTAVVVQNEAQWRHLIDNVIPWLDERKLKLHAVYTALQVGRDDYTIDPFLKANIDVLRRHNTMVWLPVTSRVFKSSDPAADEVAVKGIRAVADLGLPVSIYPHIVNLVERVSDAVRLAEKVNRKDVTITFNLCHWLRTDGAESMDEMLRRARPHLSVVTINGADRDAKDWIQPLDSGDFDVAAFLRALDRMGFRGPIGLQGYSVAVRLKIAPEENLRRSMAAWQKLHAR